MKKVFQRLLMFIIGLPLLIIILMCFPQFNHFAFGLVVVAVSVLGAVEFQNILRQKGPAVSVPEAAVLGGLAPALTVLHVSFGLDSGAVTLVFCLGACWVIVSRAFVSQEKLDACTFRAATGLSLLVYPGFLMSWITRMALFPHADAVILTYLLISFLNDSAAWTAGMLFGKNNRGLIAASPNKSVAGFIGGMLVSTIIGAGAAFFFSEIFVAAFIPGPAAGAILGFLTGAGAVLGDLGESALKRSAQVKDSGSIIPGRGGILDSIDSLAVAAPVYFLVFTLFFVRA
jgi:phosphatidate cytidylyltransferase